MFDPSGNISIIQYMLEKGADPNALSIFNGDCSTSKNRQDITPLVATIWFSYFPGIRKYNFQVKRAQQIIALLLKHGADPNKQSTATWQTDRLIGSPLAAAALGNITDIAQQLIAAKANVKSDAQAIANAIQHSSLDVLNLLLDSGADITKVSVKGKSYKDLIDDQKKILQNALKQIKQTKADIGEIQRLLKQYNQPKPTAVVPAAA